MIIPALDEAANLDRLLADLQRAEDVALEICVVDGGSSDDSVEIAERRGVRVVQSRPGRAIQMNVGRALLDAPWLLFLHADSRILRPDTIRRGVDAMRLETSRHGPRVAGHFALRFRRDPDDHDIAYRFLERKTTLNRPHTTNGDQGLLIASRFFDELGGFDESLPFLEDQRLARQIRTVGRWVTLPGEIETSARRFAVEGFGRRYFVMAVIMSAWNAELDEFFAVAPDLYRPQSETERLPIEPVIEAVWAAMRRAGLRRSMRAWLAVGRFARENGWQVAFYLDTLLDRETGTTPGPFLRWWDANLGDVEHPVIDAVVAAGLFAAVMWGVPWLASNDSDRDV